MRAPPRFCERGPCFPCSLGPDQSILARSLTPSREHRRTPRGFGPPILHATSFFPPLRSHSAVSRKPMPKFFRGALSSSEHIRLHPSFKGPDDQQRRCRGRRIVPRYFWMWRRNPPTGSLPSSQLWVASAHSSNITKSGHPIPFCPPTDSLLAIQRCQGEGRTTSPVVGEAERYPRSGHGRR